MVCTYSGRLAIDGGAQLRSAPFPPRTQFGPAELLAVSKVFEEAWASGVDFGYQGLFESSYTKAFSEFQGGGYTDAVNSGTSAIFIALAALNLAEGDEVLYSPVTDPGSVMPAVMLKLKLRIADSAPNSFNVGLRQLLEAVTPNTKAVVLTHVGGVPIAIEQIALMLKTRGIYLIEDCSQAHGAEIHGQKVGTFGDMGVFSTMFTKSHSTGGCGGLVFTRNQKLHELGRAVADRGKPFFDKNFDPKNPARFLFAALNLNQDELSCAIGSETLKKLPQTIVRRKQIVDQLRDGLSGLESVTVPVISDDVCPSYFFATAVVNCENISVSKFQFARALQAEGVTVNPDYRFVAAEWPWLARYCDLFPKTPNATAYRESTFNVLFHENYLDSDVADIVSCFKKVDQAYRKT